MSQCDPFSDMGIAGHRPTILLYNQFNFPAPGGRLEQRARERRLAAILAADVVGSCRLIGINEGGTLAQLKSSQKDAFRSQDRWTSRTHRQEYWGRRSR